MRPDRVEVVGRSRLQHGAISDRVYLMHLEADDAERVLDRMRSLAEAHGYTKLFAKVRGACAAPFLEAGFDVEAVIPAFYEDGDCALFSSRFMAAGRARPEEPEVLRDVLDASRTQPIRAPRPLADGYRVSRLGPEHSEAMAAVYRGVFESYPFPITDPEYLAGTMKRDSLYAGIWAGDRLVALASAEMDDGGAEMTDFATEPAYRGSGLAGHLLRALEEGVKAKGIRTAFTIARASSFGMNITFARAGYAYAGTLVNNTGIAGRLESMTVWYRSFFG